MTKAKTVQVRLLFDTWGEKEERFPAGTIVDLPIEAARELIASGKGERADPLPGEDE